MEFTKKMILVDPRWVQTQPQSSPVPDPLAQSVRELDSEMRDILDRQESSMSDKVHLYQKTLQRYLTRIQQVRGKPLETVEPKPQDVSEVTREHKPDLNMEKSVLESVPAAMKKKAERLLHHLKQNSDLRWNERGEISLQGHTIKNSHLVDLVNDVLRQRKQTKPPTGWDTFASALSQTNVPQELIGHPERWAYMRAQSLLSTPEEEGKDSLSLAKKPLPKKKRLAKSRWEAWEN